MSASLHDATVSHLSGSTYEPADFTHPGDRIDPVETEMVPLHDVLDAILFIVGEIGAQNNARLSVDCFKGSVGLMTYEDQSMADIGRKHGVTREAIRRRIQRYQQGIGLNIIGAVFQKQSQSGSEYFQRNHRNTKIQ